VFCLLLFTGCSSRLLTTVKFCKTVAIISLFVNLLYGWTHGNPNGVIHFTGSFE